MAVAETAVETFPPIIMIVSVDKAKQLDSVTALYPMTAPPIPYKWEVNIG